MRWVPAQISSLSCDSIWLNTLQICLVLSKFIQNKSNFRKNYFIKITKIFSLVLKLVHWTVLPPICWAIHSEGKSMMTVRGCVTTTRSRVGVGAANTPSLLFFISDPSDFRCHRIAELFTSVDTSGQHKRFISKRKRTRNVLFRIERNCCCLILGICEPMDVALPHLLGYNNPQTIVEHRTYALTKNWLHLNLNVRR